MSSISREDLFLGAPYEIDGICKVYQLTLNEIQQSMGMEKYQYFINLFTMEDSDLQKLYKQKLAQKDQNFSAPELEMSLFQYIMVSASLDKTFFLDLKYGLSTFIKEEVLISPKTFSIIIGDPLKHRVITEKEFLQFSKALRYFNNLPIPEPPPENETPMQKRFRLKREERERVKRETERKKAEESGEGADFADLISSLCVMNVGITAQNIGDHTIYQIKNLLERAQARETYYTELDMLMAGADSKKIKLKHYVRNLHKEVN